MADSSPFNIDQKAARIAALENAINQLQAQNTDLHNLLCLVIHKVANDEPFLISEKDQASMPRTGVLHVHADKLTGSLSITFKDTSTEKGSKE